MARFGKKKKKGAPAVSTASLPDIVFMLLFFFMVTTVMREVTLKVEIDKPDATETTKLEKKSLIAYLYVGRPMETGIYGPEPRIQIDDQILPSEASEIEIENYILDFRASKKESDRKDIVASFKVDADAKMGIVARMKEHLRNVDQLRIAYSVNQK